MEISDVDGSDAIAGTQWREPSGLFTQLPLSPSWAPATVQPDDVELKQRLLSYKEQVLVVDEASLYARACTPVKLSGGSKNRRTDY